MGSLHAEDMSPDGITTVRPIFPGIMIADLGAGDVFAPFAIEPVVEHHGLAVAGFHRHFVGCEEEGADAFGIIGHDFLADIIAIAAVTVGCAAETADAYRSLQIGFSAGVRG